MLDQSEYVEQAYLFKVMCERLPDDVPMQELLEQVQSELLATTKLPMAVDYLLSELRLLGTFSTAMERLSHYFTPYQTYLVREAEDDRGRFDMRIAIEILRAEAAFRADNADPSALFLFQFEVLCRNRLRYDPALLAISQDPLYDDDWREWILTVRRQVGLVDFADLLYVRSQYHVSRRGETQPEDGEPAARLLFGEKEGKIAWANRRKDPLYLFAALQRHLGYPEVPKPKKHDNTEELLPILLSKLDRLETRLKFLEDENRGGIDITKFYQGPLPPGDDPSS